MSGYKDLEIYKITFDLAIRIHHFSFKLPNFEVYEQGSQIRRSFKSVKDQISEGYGRKRYKADFIKYLTYSQGSCDETINHLETILHLYPDIDETRQLIEEYNLLGMKINRFIQYEESDWRSPK